MADLIERQAVMDTVAKSALDLNDPDENWIMQDRIKEIPSAQPEPQWIPCSDTVDIPEHEVLCCDKYGEELIGWLSYSDDQWLCESDCEMMYDPIAWREKPEPWRGRRTCTKVQ